MNVSAGLLKLERMIKSKQALIEKLKTYKGDTGLIKKTIKEHQDSIDYIKESLQFDKRFEVGELCQCTDEPKESLPKAGDEIEEGKVVGVFIKVNPINKDGSVSKQIRYVEIKEN